MEVSELSTAKCGFNVCDGAIVGLFRCHDVMVNWSNWGSGKSGENPGLCRNCDEAIASSQNTAS